MRRVFDLLVQRVGGFHLLVLTILLVALTSVAWTLSQIVRGLDLELLATMTTAGALTGWLLARARLRGRVALLFAIVLASATAFVRVGQLGNKVIALLNASAQFMAQAQLGRVNSEPLMQAYALLGVDTFTLATRLESWLRAVTRGEPKSDLVALALVWSIGIWLVAAWCAWMLRRNRNAFFAFAPLLLSLGLVLAYTGFNALTMLPPLAAFLILLVVIPHRARQNRWEQVNVPAAQDLGIDLAFTAVPATLFILVVSAFAPAFSPEQIARWAREWGVSDTNRSTALSDSFGLIPAPRPTTVFDQATSPGLPRSHLLGARPELLRQRAFTIQTNAVNAENAAHYWLGSTYDLYTGHGWVTSALQLREYNAGERVPFETLPVGRTLQQTIRMENGNGLLYAAGNVVSVDHDYQIAWRMNQDLFAAQVQAQQYRVESRVGAFNENDLRAAGENYPGWIHAQYLVLPNDLPPRVLALARDLTATEATPYDRARAIESYLRAIPYTLDVPAPPGDRDVVDYFLFDLKRGYCDYYATAMTVLARAAGVPARVAVGYAAGKYDESTATYVVTEADAHSWTQIYFPEYGWVDMEPTSARAAFAYDASAEELESSLPEPPFENANGDSSTLNRTLANYSFVVPGMFAIFFLSAILFFIVDWIRLGRLQGEIALARLYERILRVARQLGLNVSASQTPYQVATLLENYFASPARPQRLNRAWQSTSTAVNQIIALYVETTYGAHAFSPQQRDTVIRAWLRARVFLWMAVGMRVIQQRVQNR